MHSNLCLGTSKEIMNTFHLVWAPVDSLLGLAGLHSSVGLAGLHSLLGLATGLHSLVGLATGLHSLVGLTTELPITFPVYIDVSFLRCY